jgi:hypothetical protein
MPRQTWYAKIHFLFQKGKQLSKLDDDKPLAQINTVMTSIIFALRH